MANKKDILINSLLTLGILVGLLAIYAGFKMHPAQPAHAATTYTVTNGNNAGAGSLRQAITDANANPGADIIVFNGALVIQPTSSLPSITDPVEINGYTGSPGGATANSAASPNPFNGTLTVELDGQLAAGSVLGLGFESGSEGSSVRGLVIYNFSFNAIQVAPGFTGSGLTIAGNYIGTNAAGTVGQGTTLSSGIGLFGTGASNITVGGTNPADRNIISGNAGGIGGGANSNATIQGNYIGLAADGTTALANAGGGIVFYADTTNATIGGATTSAANVISGNTSGYGISITTADVNHNTIAGNFIGTDYTGAVARGNANGGIFIGSGSASNTVGGTTTGARNLISGNSSAGIFINSGGTSNTVEGNYIGTDITGATALANGTGVSILGGSSGNTIGGADTTTRNIISGNGGMGLSIDTSNSNTVASNYIGVDVTGTADLGNGGIGVAINNSASSNTIGGTTASERNVISGNADNGVYISGTGTNNTILGNYLGTNASGSAAIPNDQNGLFYLATGTGNVLGGLAEGSRNILSGNSNFGVICSSGANLSIQGNYVGLSADGATTIPNVGAGNSANIALTGCSNMIIGGSATGARNVISGSLGAGILMIAGGNNTVQGNYIGTKTSGEVQSGFGNSTAGIIIASASTNNLIGGVNSGEGNIIAGNGAGVAVGDIGGIFLAQNNSILGNSIHDNSSGPLSSLGIDLLGNTNDFVTWSSIGVTPNDAGDPDVTSNVLMNFPVIQSVTSTNGQATITYDLDINDAEPGATGYRVEFFANDSADPSGHGQGQTYLGSDTVAGDVNGRSATLTLPAGVDGSKYVSATTTMTDASDDGFGHTSEFAADVQATLVPVSPTPTPSPAANVLATTGLNQNRSKLILAAIALVLLGGTGLYVARRQKRT